MAIPIYQVIENDIKRDIKEGRLQQGDIIPSENELKDMYKVSRMTVRQALNNLVNDGYLYRHKGKGTFVSSRKIEKSIHGVRGFTEEMESMNKKVSNKVISFESKIATEEIADKLFLNVGDEIIYIERVRSGDGEPVLFEQLHLPKALFKDLNKKIMTGSFYNYIENSLNMRISHTIQSIEAKLPDQKTASALNIEKNQPVLFIMRNTFLSNGRPFEYVKSYYRADSYRFVQHAVKG